MSLLPLTISFIFAGIYSRIRQDAVANDLTEWATCVSLGGVDCRQRKTFATAPNLMGHLNAVTSYTKIIPLIFIKIKNQVGVFKSLLILLPYLFNQTFMGILALFLFGITSENLHAIGNRFATKKTCNQLLGDLLI